MSRIQYSIHIYLIMIALTFSLGVHAFPRFTNITTKNGLPTNNLTCIIQDSIGFIWIGTSGQGLVRYDGYSFKQYAKITDDKNSLISNDVSALFIDSQNRLWVGTTGGISLYNPTLDQFISIIDTVLAVEINYISSFTEDASGNILAASMGGTIFSIDDSLKVSTYFPLDTLFPGANVVLMDSDRTLWIGYETGIFNQKPNGTQNYYTQKPGELSGTTVMRIYENPHDNNEIYICHANGINVFNKKQNTFLEVEPWSQSGLFPESLLIDSDNNLWAPGLSNISRLDLGTRKISAFAIDNCFNYGLKNSSIVDLMEDQQGNIWGPTASQGIIQIAKTKAFEIVNNTPYSIYPISKKNIGAISMNQDHMIIGYKGGGLDIIDRRSDQIKRLTGDSNDPKSIGDGDVFTIYQDSKDRYWLGCFTCGLQQIDPGTGTVKTYSHDPDNELSIPRNDIRSIVEGPDGLLYLSTHGSGITAVDPETGNVERRLTQEENGLMHNWALDVLFDNNKSLWVVISGGVSRLDLNSNQFVNYYHNEKEPTSIPDPTVNVAFIDKEGKLWFGTKNGLALFQPNFNNFKVFDQKNGLPNVVIMSIAEDNAGNLWLGTVGGLVKFNPNTESATTYFEEDGTASDNYAKGVATSTYQGEFFFGGPEGLVIFHPDNIGPNTFKPNVVITEFLIDNEPVTIGDKNSILQKSIGLTDQIVLKPNHKMITLRFASLNFLNTPFNQYEYMLENYDEDWIDLGHRREVSFTNLNPGEYTLKILGSNNDGIRKEIPVTLKIRVRYPWYQTVYFYISLLLFIAFVIYSFVKWREKKINEDRAYLKAQVEKEQERVRQHEEEIRQRDEAEREQRWIEKGVAYFADMISKNKDSIEHLASQLLTQLIKYTETYQGSITVLNDDYEDDKHLEIIATYAYEQYKIEAKRIEINEGLIGSCFTSGEIQILENLPDNYLKVVSGIGEASPKYLALIPMRLDEMILGVIEVASFNPIPKSHITLIEKVSENATSVLFTLQASKKTIMLLEQSKTQHDQLKLQEEEMRENLEQMQTAMEEFTRKERDYKELINKYEKELGKK